MQPYRDIFIDEDGSVTKKGPGSWITPYYKHHDVPECEHDPVKWGGVFCDNSVQVRRVAFTAITPADRFISQSMYIAVYDDNKLKMNGTVADKEAQENKDYINDVNNYGEVKWKEYQDPGKSWAVPMVTGHKYRIQWGAGNNDWDPALDWEKMQIFLSEMWRETDKSIYLVHPFTDKRAQLDVKVKSGSAGWGELIDNNTITTAAHWSVGQNVLY